MFLGEHSHALDSKGRIFVPAKYREELGEEFVITKSVDRCLTVYTLPEWEKLKAKLDALPSTKSRQVKRFIFSNAVSSGYDAQGRVNIPAALREYAGIKHDAVVIGVGSYLEIWAEEEWNAAKESEVTADIAELMEELDF